MRVEGARAGDPATLVADSARACAVLGWRPRRQALDTQLTDAWRWLAGRRGLVAEDAAEPARPLASGSSGAHAPGLTASQRKKVGEGVSRTCLSQGGGGARTNGRKVWGER